ncbi:hypothetical protein SAMN05421812_12059 [Asanoa hainanensis]|uniref:Uncharacterized protein n=1 Tax=Asanoa hainanensis TaxID=560556 RepID=A0A239PET5_9ACTN|nr:hypothetical protein SAMN05421812_12059 [Asanoa hainanensis]
MLRQRVSRPQWHTPRGIAAMPNTGLSDHLKLSEHSAYAGRWLT